MDLQIFTFSNCKMRKCRYLCGFQFTIIISVVKNLVFSMLNKYTKFMIKMPEYYLYYIELT